MYTYMFTALLRILICSFMCLDIPDQDGSPYYIIGIVESGARAEVAEADVEFAEPGLHHAGSRTTSGARLMPSESGDESSHSENDISLESATGPDLGELAYQR